MPRPLYSGEKTSGTHWIGGCVGPRTGRGGGGSSSSSGGGGGGGGDGSKYKE